MDWKNKKILVTGGSGFLGSAVIKILKKRGAENITIPHSDSCDLRQQNNCNNVTKNVDIVFHLAAKVGGIGLNQEKPGELFYDNITMGTNVMEQARKNNVEKFIALGTICSYPIMENVSAMRPSSSYDQAALIGGLEISPSSQGGLTGSSRIMPHVVARYSYASIRVDASRVFSSAHAVDELFARLALDIDLQRVV